MSALTGNNLDIRAWEKQLKRSLDFLDRRFPEDYGHAVLMFLCSGEAPIHCAINLQRADRRQQAEQYIRWYGTPIDRRDIYLGVANYAVAPSGKAGATRTKAMVGHVRALYCERDEAMLGAELPKPSYTIATSVSRFQDYWELDQPISGADAEPYLRRIAAACGLGNQAVDCARVLRLPGTQNFKPDRNGEIVTVVHDNNIVYTLEDFAHLPQVATGHASRSASNGASEERKIPEGARHSELVRAAGSMRHYGIGKDHIYEALAGMNDEQCVPPLEDDEVRRIADSANWKPEPPPAIRKSKATNGMHSDEKPAVDPETGEILPPPAAPTPINERILAEPPPTRPFTDTGNAERLADRHGRDLRYCHTFAKWFVYDERRWRRDDTDDVARRAKETIRSIYAEAEQADTKEEREAIAKHAIRSEAEQRRRAMVNLTASEIGIPVRPDDLDANAWLFNVENGTIDLRSGLLRPHDRRDLITKVAPVVYDPHAVCPRFDAFLAQILPNQSLRKFVQTAFGHSMTGDTREDVIFINFGSGSNGKTTLMQTMQALFGDFASQTSTDTLMIKRNEGVPNDVAALKGARLVAASEGEEGKRLAESLIKSLTGGDKISARFMRAEWFEFEPTFKIWLSTNHKPIIRGTDTGIWRRIRLIPFGVTIPEEECDETLPEKLRAELPGILNWALEGCRDWLQNGLGMPEAVKEATRSYRDEMDILARFIEDSCIQHKNAFIPAADIYAAYRKWAEHNGERYETQTGFGKRLRERGFADERKSGKRGWVGISLPSHEVQDEF